jgi:hypothetical protein
MGWHEEEAIPWVTYDDPPRAILEACGALVLLQGSLETALFLLLSNYMRLSPDGVYEVFHELSNQARTRLVTKLAAEAALAPDAAEAVAEAVRRYDICTENRNVIGHSQYLERHEDQLLFHKSPTGKGSGGWYFAISEVEMANIVSATRDAVSYVQAVWYALTPKAAGSSPPPLLGTSLPPRKLSLFQLPEDHLDDLLPPRSSPGWWRS